MRRPALFLVLVALATLPAVTGCRSGGVREDPIMRLSGEEALTEGKALLEAKKYRRARRYLTHAFEVAPNSRGGREALLLVADTYYLQGGLTNFIQAEAKYRDYLNRFPTSNQAAYAQFQVANSLARRMQRADRDQSPTLKALNAYEELLRLYPTSEYAEQAEEQMRLVEENLARHELLVARFNFSFRNYPGTISRLEFLSENYEDFSDMDEALYLLGLAYRQSRSAEHQLQSALAFDRLRSEYPDSAYVAKIPSPKKIDPAEAAQETPAEGADEAGDGSEEEAGNGRESEAGR